MKLKRLDFKEITLGFQMEPIADTRIFIPSRSNKEPPPPPPPVFDEAQMQESEREGFKKGFAAGEKEGHHRAQSEQSDINTQLVAMKEQFVKAISPLFDHYRQMVMQAQKDVPAIALAIAKKIAGDVLHENAQTLITDIAVRTCETMLSEPELTIIVHESMADTMERKLQEMAGRLPAATKIVIVRDPEMPLSDCRIEWQNGALERVTTQLWQQVEKSLGNMEVAATRETVAEMDELQQQVSTINEGKKE